MGLLNRHAGEAEFKRNQLQAQNQLRPYGVILGDIDLFKRVNDRFGHIAGDRVLKTVAHVLSSKMRSYDHAVRWGGEEFLIILSNASLSVTMGWPSAFAVPWRNALTRRSGISPFLWASESGSLARPRMICSNARTPRSTVQSIGDAIRWLSPWG